MLTSMKNNRSLTFYQPTESIRSSGLSSSYAGGIASVAIANTSFVTATTTSGLNSQITLFRSQITEYNAQLNKFLTTLANERVALSQKLSERLAQNPSYTGMRNDGVNLAWDYEAADVKMGGSGSAQWTPAQQEEILQNRPEIVNKTKWVDGKPEYPKGGVRGQQGHHINSVAAHPTQQVDPDNIKFLDGKEHLDAHGGSWKNPTEGDLKNGDKMLKDTNATRVKTKNEDIALTKKNIIKNELRGLGIAVAIGLGVGVTIGFIVTLAQSGVTPESLKLATIEGAKSGVEAGVLSGVGYIVSRIGEVAAKAVAGLLENLGVRIAENLSKMVNMAVVGGLTIIVFSTYQFIKLKRQGLATRDALLQVGKQALFSLSLLAVSIAVQGPQTTG
ncbi:hypothetical protein FACS1894216_05210 [Synergistales bacterium]|nr:hypothetical protein FACS1894216_05210 [Synergistales bacterium]